MRRSPKRRGEEEKVGQHTPGLGFEEAESGNSGVAKVSPLQPPIVGEMECNPSEASGAAEEGIQFGPFNGVDAQFSDASQRLWKGVRRILVSFLKPTLSLRQVGPCLVQCFHFCCKPLSMADEGDYGGIQSSSADTVSSGPPLAVWGQATGLALRSMSGELHEDKPSILKRVEVKKSIERQLERFDMWDVEATTCTFNSLFQSRGVDYTGEMVRLAQPLKWQAVANSLPEGVGQLKLEDFCVAGTKYYVVNFEEYIIPVEDQVPPKAPRVQVEEGSWDALCEGLVSRGICEYTPMDQLHTIQGVPLLNGLFAVGKVSTSTALKHNALL